MVEPVIPLPDGIGVDRVQLPIDQRNDILEREATRQIWNAEIRYGAATIGVMSGDCPDDGSVGDALAKRMCARRRRNRRAASAAAARRVRVRGSRERRSRAVRPAVPLRRDVCHRDVPDRADDGENADNGTAIAFAGSCTAAGAPERKSAFQKIGATKVASAPVIKNPRKYPSTASTSPSRRSARRE